jgi:hypothetical protein
MTVNESVDFYLRGFTHPGCSGHPEAYTGNGNDVSCSVCDYRIEAKPERSSPRHAHPQRVPSQTFLQNVHLLVAEQIAMAGIILLRKDISAITRRITATGMSIELLLSRSLDASSVRTKTFITATGSRLIIDSETFRYLATLNMAGYLQNNTGT